MESTVNPMVLGPLMIMFTMLWFGTMFWMGMREDDTPQGSTRLPKAGDRGPWWTNEAFQDAPAAAFDPVAAERRGR